MTNFPYLIIDTNSQTLTLYQKDKQTTYLVSTAKNGTGQLQGSECTPLGRHTIAQKIGADMPMGAVFIGRVFTGEICTPELVATNPDRDWITSRILWLDGCEEGINRGKTADGMVCDSKARYIYIHGTPDSEPMGIPKSHGCVRMRNADVVELFEQVEVGTVVEIVA